MHYIILGFWGLCIGSFVSGGVCALLTSVGVVTRLAWRTKTESSVKFYEKAILVGGVVGNTIFIYNLTADAGRIIAIIMLGIVGLFFGIFVGCLAMSLAEALDASTIVFRKINLRNHTKYVILAVVIGKFIGNIIYFTK